MAGAPGTREAGAVLTRRRDGETAADRMSRGRNRPGQHELAIAAGVTVWTCLLAQKTGLLCSAADGRVLNEFQPYDERGSDAVHPATPATSTAQTTSPIGLTRYRAMAAGGHRTLARVPERLATRSTEE